MMSELVMDKRVLDMTVADLVKLFARFEDGLRGTVHAKEYVYGMSGIATLFNKSIATAHRIKKSGIIDEAIVQRGRTIIVDKELALKLYNTKNQKQYERVS